MLAARSITALSLLALGSLGGLSPAHAEDEATPVGHYIESEIPGHSSVFRSVGESTARTFDQVEGNLQAVDGQLAKMALSVGLVGGAVDADAASLWKSRLDARSATFGYEFNGVQVRLNQMQVAYEEAFTAAMQRALDALAAEGKAGVVPCTAKKQSAMEAMAAGGPGATTGATTTHCPGSDFTQEIARRWDSDPVLEERMLEVVGGELGPLVVGMGSGGEPMEYSAALGAGGWPKITEYDEAGNVLALTGQGAPGGSWLHPADLVLSMPELAEALDTIDTLSSAARAELQETVKALPRDANGDLIQDEASMPRIEAVQSKARGIREFTDGSRAQVGALVWATLSKARKKGKKDGWADVGVCLNPPGFGGCSGLDASDMAAEVLAGDKKLTAALAELTEGLVGPDVAVP